MRRARLTTSVSGVGLGKGVSVGVGLAEFSLLLRWLAECGFGEGCFPGCAMELPRRRKKSPIGSEDDGGAAARKMQTVERERRKRTARDSYATFRDIQLRSLRQNNPYRLG